MENRHEVFENAPKGRKLNQIKAQIDELVNKLTYKTLQSPKKTAQAIYNLIINIIEANISHNAEELFENFKRLGHMLIEKDRNNFVVRNCFERFLKVLKDSCNKYGVNFQEGSVLPKFQTFRDLIVHKN